MQQRVLKALVTVSSGQPGRARRVLGLSPNQTAELEWNQSLESAPAAAASAVYSGVLFDALSYDALPAAARRRLDRWVLVSSALWGAVRLTDVIPAYRLSAGTTLPRIGSVTSAWRKPLSATLPQVAGTRPILDLRSGGYAAMWSPETSEAIVGKVVQRQPDGTLRVVSHHNKATKGRMVNDLARQSKTPKTADALLALLNDLGYETAEVAAKPGRPRTINVLVDEL